MVTGKQYAEKALTVLNLDPAPGCIYGTRNRLWTSADQDAIEQKYHRDPVKYKNLEMCVKYGRKLIGHRVWDSGGLTSWAGSLLGLNYHHSSNRSWENDCRAKGKKTPGLKLPIGAWVYTGNNIDRGHIGIVISDTQVLEAQGTAHGIVKSKLSLAKWTWWGLGKYMQFDFIPENVENI